jgi:acetolactate synthase I/II/III large subunit
MNGAMRLVNALTEGNVDVCFANPGTSEMHFVSALDRCEGMRCVLGLYEGVVTGAADGFYRIANRPAATLLHLGPGLANGLANLHNARKARSGVVNIVGEHALSHRALNAPLTCDIETLAAPMSEWVRTIGLKDDIAKVTATAVARARRYPAEIATIILPADIAWSEFNDAGTSPSSDLPDDGARTDDLSLREIVTALKRGESTLLLLGGAMALTEGNLRLAGRISAAAGCALMSEFYVPRIERGAGRVHAPRLPYSVDDAVALLKKFDTIILVGARLPIAFFGYPDKPGILSRSDAKSIELCRVGDDPQPILEALCAELKASSAAAVSVREDGCRCVDSDDLHPDTIGRVLASTLPEGAIVVDESLTTGRQFDGLTHHARPHDWLTGMGGSIGFALPAAIGASIAAPDRRVIALEGDGSGMYCPQALWTMVREGLKITVVIFANREYRILRGELARVGAHAPGPKANSMLNLTDPTLDWVALAKSMGMEATRVASPEAFHRQMQRAVASDGPFLIEALVR